MANNRYCVIMAGGVGTRFWPMSRQSCPKQFLDILGMGKSFIRHTYERFNNIVPKENFIIVTNRRYKELVMQHIPELDESQILCEPIGRNTAPCIAYAAYSLKKRNPDAEMIITPADHLILNEKEFQFIVEQALDFVHDNHALMTIGITPTRPETGYGYIQRTNDNDICKVKCFTEKPNREMADAFWNVVNFCGTQESLSGSSVIYSMLWLSICPSIMLCLPPQRRIWVRRGRRWLSSEYSRSVAP